MKVLSLFDGLGSGRLALERAGIEVEAYYASEIERYAIAVTRTHYSEVIQLGAVEYWREWKIPWAEIDLLLGGSPCQGFSKVGNGLNFADPKSKLFFYYVDVLEKIKTHNPGVLFLLENVRMRFSWRDVISEYLGVEPVDIDSALVSGQSRQRFYWTNIGMIEQPKDRGILLADVLESGTVDREKSYCIDANYFKAGDLKNYKDDNRRQLVYDRGEYRRLTPLECERLQTLPDGWTQIDHPKYPYKKLVNWHRYKMLGNAWTVDVITHILEHIGKDVEPAIQFEKMMPEKIFGYW